MEILVSSFFLLLILGIALVLFTTQKKVIANQKIEIQQKNEQLTHLQVEKTKIEERLALKENLGGLLESNFQNIANKILEQKNDTLIKHNKQQIDGLLNPLQQKITEFQSQFRENQNKTTEERALLKNELEQLKNLNQTIGLEAKNLTETLKGDKKAQGDWGEMILEKVLELSGLVKDREYSVQKQFYGESDSGLTRLRPDVILHLPANKKIVIDSKVSLVHYHNFIHTQDEKDKMQAKKQQLDAMRQHIKSLSQKAYHEIPENSLDFVIMFVPIESAFVLLVEDYKLYQEAYLSGVIPLSPSILMGFLKTIYKIWNLEKQDENARKIVDEASKMYDKFVNFLESFEKIGLSLDGSFKSYNNAKKQLFEGRGNLVDKAKNLQDLGINSQKQFPAHK